MGSPGVFIAKGIAVGRVAFGVACMTVPRKVLGPAGEDAAGPFVSMTRTFGVRDLVLGAGTYLALAKDPQTAIRWVEVGAVADALDVANAVVFGKELDANGKRGVIALAVPATIGGIVASRLIRRG